YFHPFSLKNAVLLLISVNSIHYKPVSKTERYFFTYIHFPAHFFALFQMMKNRKSYLYSVIPLYILFKLQESYESFFTFSTISSTSERLTFSRPSSIAFKVRFAKANGILQNRMIVLVSMEAIYWSPAFRFFQA